MSNSNKDGVTSTTQTGINLDLYGTSTYYFELEEVTSAASIDNEITVPMSELPTNIHTLQQANEDTECINELGLQEGNPFQGI